MAVLFCPQSCHGALAQRLKEQEVLLSKLTGETVKVQEVSGTTISQMLTRSNPFKTKCDEPCVLCESTGGRQDCTRRGILYSLECTRCLELVEQQEAAKKDDKKKPRGEQESKEEQKVLRSLYIGESARCAKLRLQTEHIEQYEASDPDCHMTKHYHECHKGEEKPKFKAKVLKYFTQAYLRQLGEATYLWRLSRQNGVNIRILNSKGMYNRCSLERLTLESSTDGSKSESSIEKEKNEDKKLVEDQSPTNSNPTLSNESIPNTSSKVKKVSRRKTKTEGQQAKSADITQYFHRLPN